MIAGSVAGIVTMNAILRNRIDWPFMSEIDDYLTALHKAAALAARVSAMRSEINKMIDPLLEVPRTAAAKVPDNWPARSDLLALLNETTAAFDDAGARYDRLAADAKPHVTAPYRKIADAITRSVPIQDASIICGYTSSGCLSHIDPMRRGDIVLDVPLTGPVK